MKEKMKVLLSDLWTAIRWGIILSFVMLGVLWLSDRLHIFDSMPSSESLIITFIGILATFVVVSNFSQVANIEEKADRKIKEIEKKVNVISERCLDESKNTSLASSIIQTKEMIDIIKGGDELKSLETVKMIQSMK